MNPAELRRRRAGCLRVRSEWNQARLLVTFFVGLFFLVACRKESPVNVAARLHPEEMPTMTTTNVATLISDSGVTQYKIVSPVWKVYNEGDTPKWIFPKGLFLQKYDRKFKVTATVAADSVVYLVKNKLWKLMGRVEIIKKPRDLFLSERLFWDERDRKIYSDTFIHIENETHVLEGTGFVSNDQLTVYRVLDPTGIFPVDRSEFSSSSTSAPSGVRPSI